MAIQSFGDTMTEEFFYTGNLPGKGCRWSAQRAIVARKLDMLDAAVQLQDLRAPPGNRLERLERLSSNLEGWHSIRVNDQWRVIFRWTDAGPGEVQIVDYH